MNRIRVVVTGIGAVSNIGIGVNEFSAGLRAGLCAASKVSSFDTQGFPQDIACEIKKFVPENWVKTLDPKKMGRSSQLAIAAAKLAIDHAGIDKNFLRNVDVDVTFGTTDGESMVGEALTQEYCLQGPASIDAEKIKVFPPNQIALSVCKELEIEGESMTITSACAAGNHAIGHAFDRISLGDTDSAVCGGVDAISRKTMLGFYRMGTLASSVCKPFDKDRDGILTAEGSGVFFLESLESAQTRGAKIYAEILGYGLNCDANHPVFPLRESIAQCMRVAHRNSGVTANQIDYISAHGTGTTANDLVEAGAICDVFGENPPPVSSIKSMLGHTMGAASALGAIACVLGINEGFIPPTINHNETDSECNIDCVPNVVRPATLNIVQNNGFAFGGNNAILILSKFDSDKR